MRSVIASAAALSLIAPGWCLTYTATNTADSGAGSLRQAIMDANAHTGTDKVTFAAGLSGRKIKPLGALPALTEQTVVDGDLNDDHAPDITLDGSLFGGDGNGLTVRGDQCTIQGLAVMNFPEAGVLLDGVEGCTVRDCHLGVNLAGDAAAPSPHGDVRILDGRGHVIGEPGRGNILAGQPDGSLVGVGCEEAVIEGNYFGLDRAGAATLPSDGLGIALQPGGALGARLNTIRGNVFAGIDGGLALYGADENTIQGNLFGLAADGSTTVALTDWGIDLEDGACDNVIGGQEVGPANVFCGGEATTGVHITGAETKGNRIEGNYFGMDAAGTARRTLMRGVGLQEDGGEQVIGGSTSAAGNYFASDTPANYWGVLLQEAGPRTQVCNNTFGALPNGARAKCVGNHLMAVNTTQVEARYNLFDSGNIGLHAVATTAAASIEATGNRFRNLWQAVQVTGAASVVLGNLGNASTDDDGGNTFSVSNTSVVGNYGPNRVPAEGNWWGTTVRKEIETRVYDKQDNPAYGRVDFDPLAGGVSPTGETRPAMVSGATAIPTAGGAEVVFSLSAPAEVTVTVVNVGGRPVATVVQDRATEVGLQRVSWSGRSATGTRVPDGRYLVRITARSTAGAEATALTSLRVER